MKLLVLGDFQGKFSNKLEKKLKKEEFDLAVVVGDLGGISDWRPWIMKNLRDSKKGKAWLTPEKFFGKKVFKELIKKDVHATKEVFRKLNNLGKPVVFIFGNGDDGWYSYPFGSKIIKADKRLVSFVKNLKNIKDITYSQIKFGNKNFVGFGGYMDIEAFMDKKVFPEAKERKNYLARLNRLNKGRKNLLFRLKKINGEKIFILHYPPLGVFDIIRDKKDNPMNGKSAGVRFFREAIKKYKPKLVLCGHMHEYRGMKKLYGIPVINPGDAEKDKYAIVELDEKTMKVKTKFMN